MFDNNLFMGMFTRELYNSYKYSPYLGPFLTIGLYLHETYYSGLITVLEIPFNRLIIFLFLIK